MGGVGTHAESVISGPGEGKRPNPGVDGRLQAGQHFRKAHVGWEHVGQPKE